jgi:hypothetical protein
VRLALFDGRLARGRPLRHKRPAAIAAADDRRAPTLYRDIGTLTGSDVPLDIAAQICKRSQTSA